MTPERWAQVEKICQDAFDCSPEERTAFLDKACGNDESLRREVESLLAYESQAENFIEDAPDDFAAEIVAGHSDKTGTASKTREIAIWLE